MDGDDEELPPLLGVPCTIKESFKVSGATNAVGHPGRTAIRCDGDAPTVQRLRRAGAIPIITTAVSELAMWLESSTCLHGTTCNVYDVSRIVGGSSGGEGAIVGAGFCAFASMLIVNADTATR